MTISRQDIDATIELLCERFPRAFFRFERWRVPLKLRIRDDLIAALGDTIDPELIGLALKGYTRNWPIDGRSCKARRGLISWASQPARCWKPMRGAPPSMSS